MELLCRARADDCVIYANAPRKSQRRIRGRIMGSEFAVRSGCCSDREISYRAVERWLGRDTGFRLECASAWRSAGDLQTD